MTQVIRVLVADDHALMREGICALMKNYPDIEVIGEAENGRVAIQMTQKLRPDIVLMDIAMPQLNGLDATRQIKRDFPEINVLVLTMYDHEEYIRPALKAGASGYVLKQAAASEMVAAIRAVYRGEAVLSPAITRLVLDDYLHGEGEASETDLDKLTLREREVLQLIAEGHTNREIAEILHISIKTVKSHRTNLMQKLDLHDRGDLIKYAIQKKIIKI